MLPEDAISLALAELVESLRMVGTVSGTSGNRVLVSVRGSLMTLPRLTSYTPTVGDVVNIIGPAPFLVIGTTAL